MYPDWALPAGLVILIWLLGLSFFIFWERQFLNSLFPKSGERDIRKKFEEIVGVTSEFRKQILTLSDRLGSLEERSLGHLQRVTLLRYNPYEDTGGDQSFTACFLDQMGNGVVVTSLHTRAGTRVFAKPVVKGKSSKYQFSKEEEEVVKQAMSEKL